MNQKVQYEPPEVGTVFRLRSKYSEEKHLDIIKKIADILENKGMISERMKPSGYNEQIVIRLKDYITKIPERKHMGHWINSGRQVAMVHPETFFPFFFNDSGSKIIRLCNGKRSIEQISLLAKRNWSSLEKLEFTKDVVRFFFLLDELDLIDFRGEIY